MWITHYLVLSRKCICFYVWVFEPQYCISLNVIIKRYQRNRFNRKGTTISLYICPLCYASDRQTSQETYIFPFVYWFIFRKSLICVEERSYIFWNESTKSVNKHKQQHCFERTQSYRNDNNYARYIGSQTLVFISENVVCNYHVSVFVQQTEIMCFEKINMSAKQL